MTRKEAKSCIGTIELLQRLAYNIHGVMDVIDADNCKKIIEALKKEPRKGHWIKEESPYGWDGHSYQCSECGRSIHLDTEMEDLEDYPYCHCGAKMQEVKE